MWCARQEKFPRLILLIPDRLRAQSPVCLCTKRDSRALPESSFTRDGKMPWLDLFKPMSGCSLLCCTGRHCPNKKYWRNPEVYLKLFLRVLYCTQKVSLWWLCGNFITYFLPKFLCNYSLGGRFTCNSSQKSHLSRTCQSWICKLWQ